MIDNAIRKNEILGAIKSKLKKSQKKLKIDIQLSAHTTNYMILSTPDKPGVADQQGPLKNE